MSKPYANMTPRERLIEAASAYLRRSGDTLTRDTAHMAIEAVLDSCHQLPATTFGGQMSAYYRGISQNALERLTLAVLHDAEKSPSLTVVEPVDVVVSAPVTLAFTPEILTGQLSPASIKMYARDFKAYAVWACDNVLEPATFARWRNHLAQETEHSPNTINRMLSAVKRIIQEAAQQGYVTHELALGFDRIEGVKVRALRERTKQTARTKITPVDMRRLIDAPDITTLRGIRDAALLATLQSSGLRVSELATLTIGQISKRGKGYVLSVLGKTDTEQRDAPLSIEAYDRIQAWVSARTVDSDYIFTSFGGRGSTRATDKAMTGVAVWQTIQQYADLVNLSHVKPHDFRRFVGTQLAAKDIRQAQKALGHKSINTTARFYVLDELEPGLTDNLC